jgi:hypothetical protein
MVTGTQNLADLNAASLDPFSVVLLVTATLAVE